MAQAEYEYIFVAVYDEGTEYEAKVSGKIYAPDKGTALLWVRDQHPLANRIWIR